MLHNLWMTPLCFMWCIKISVTGRNGRVCIISPATRARNTRPMHKRFTYLSWPRANWSWNMLWIFHGKIVLSNPPSSTPPSAPPYHTPFRNSYKRRNTSNLDSRLKNWKTIFSVVLSSASRNTRWLNAVEAESKMLSLPFVLLLFRQFSPAIGFNILGICPSASYSHQQPFQALMKALAARGHNVTMISTIPSKKSIKNYEDVDLSFSYRKRDCTGLRHMGAFTLLHKNMREANELCEEQLFSTAITHLIS